MLPWASLLALLASEYPSGLDHQLRHAQVFAAWSAGSFEVGCGGSGGSSSLGAVDSVPSLAVSVALAGSASSVRPSEETLTLVVEVGSALPLLDLRLVRNLVGESSLGFFASSPGTSPVAPPLTPITSVAVFTIAGAFDRQLPDPLSHFFPFGVWAPVLLGVDAPGEADVDAANDAFDGAFCSTPLSLGVWDVVVSAALFSDAAAEPVPVLLASAGACEFGFAFLRGLIRAGSEKELSRRKGL
jgi:hypothetical protein